MFLNERTRETFFNAGLLTGTALAAVLAGALEACSSDTDSPFSAASGGAKGSDGGEHTSATGGESASGGSAGSGGKASTGGATGAGACLPALAGCGDPGATCCAGSICTEQGGAKRCVQTCSQPSDCGSLCCADDATTGKKLCAPSSECPPLACSGVAGPCEQPGPTCCEGLTCVSAKAPEYKGCRKPCKEATECDTGCCVPYANAALGFCADSAACACSGTDDACGGARHCCDGLACTSFDASGAFACKPKCEKNDDCGTKCCRPITGTTESACLPSSWCQ